MKTEQWLNYHPYKHNLPGYLKEWLLHPGSFMARLREHGITGTRIDVLQQRWLLPDAEERKILRLNPRQIALIREVIILNNEKQWMFARTVIPFSTLAGKNSCLARLKNRALGSLLFKDKSMRRSEFEITLVKSPSELFDKATQKYDKKPAYCWARRSVFELNKKPFLLTEVFFPESYEF